MKGRQSLIITAWLEVFYGAYHISYRYENRNKRQDKDAVMGLMFGTALLFYGQALFMLAMRPKKIPVSSLIFGKALLALAALLYGITIMGDITIAPVSCLLYAVLGMPFAAAIHQMARRDASDPRLAGLSESEQRAKAGKAPGSQAAPISSMGPAGYPMMSAPASAAIY
eukprot:TRINITY_DN116430_c0_g1_i1.p1 TRINITY_DN116430_c0_g1~~TRINITY_DN116430_c0_g1_i1.p1  ORF type:complete len:169 (-),score=25.39 TRINITY_DN116430_c0_g1_i1:99-605(-)